MSGNYRCKHCGGFPVDYFTHSCPEITSAERDAQSEADALEQSADQRVASIRDQLKEAAERQRRAEYMDRLNHTLVYLDKMERKRERMR